MYIYIYIYIYIHTHKLGRLVHLLRCNHCWFLSYRTKYLLTISSGILSVTCASIKKVLPKFHYKNTHKETYMGYIFFLLL